MNIYEWIKINIYCHDFWQKYLKKLFELDKHLKDNLLYVAVLLKNYKFMMDCDYINE